MKDLKVEGTINEIGSKQTFGNETNPFVKQEIILFEDTQYPNYYKIEFQGGNTEKLVTFKPGDQVTITLNIVGKRWDNKEGKVSYFTSMVAWKIEKK